jgi:hypothetical protein
MSTTPPAQAKCGVDAPSVARSGQPDMSSRLREFFDRHRNQQSTVQFRNSLTAVGHAGRDRDVLKRRLHVWKPGLAADETRRLRFQIAGRRIEGLQRWEVGDRARNVYACLQG